MARARIAHEVDSAKIEENANSPELKTFALTLNALLTEKNIHQNAMANDIGIAPGSITNYRNGIKEPRLSTIVKIAKYLDVDCNYLMTGIQAENSTIAADLGLSDKSINCLRYCKLAVDRGKFAYSLNAMLEQFQEVHALFVCMTEFAQTVSMVQKVMEQASDDDFEAVYQQQDRFLSPRQTYTLNGFEECNYRRQLIISHFTEMLDSITKFSEFKSYSRNRAAKITQAKNENA